MLLDRFGRIVQRVVQNVRILQNFINRTVHFILAAVIPDGCADDLRFLRRSDLQFVQHLPGIFCAEMCMVIIAAGFVCINVMEQPRHRGKFRVLPAFLRQDRGGESHAVQMCDRAGFLFVSFQRVMDIFLQLLDPTHEHTPS